MEHWHWFLRISRKTQEDSWILNERMRPAQKNIFDLPGLLSLAVDQVAASLEFLDLTGTQITDAGLAEIKAALPKCAVTK